MARNHQKVVETTLTIQDLQEHLRLVKESIEQESRNLTEKVEERKNLDAEIASRNETISELRKIEAEIKSENESRKLELDNRESILNAREVSLFVENQKFLEFIAAETKRLDEKNLATLAELEVINQKIIDADAKLISLVRISIEEEERHEFSVKVTLAQLADATKELEEVSSALSTTNIVLHNAQKELSDLNNEILDATERLKREVDKTEDFRYNLEQREAAIERKEKDIAIIILRLKTRYQKETGMNLTI